MKLANTTLDVGTYTLSFTGNNPSHSLHSLQSILTIPEFAWELFLGIYCTFWGFKPDASILSRSAPIVTKPTAEPVSALLA